MYWVRTFLEMRTNSAYGARRRLRLLLLLPMATAAGAGPATAPAAATATAADAAATDCFDRLGPGSVQKRLQSSTWHLKFEPSSPPE